jgi:hypothetical protein
MKKWIAGLMIGIALASTCPVQATAETGITIRYPHEADHQVYAYKAGITPKPKPVRYTSVPVYTAGEVKKYEDFRAITDPTSRAYQTVQKSSICRDGTLEIGGRKLVAVGTNIGRVGQKIDFVLQNPDGQKHVLKVIIADSKRTADTRDNANYCGWDGHLIEAIVCTERIPALARRMGDLSYIDGWEGRIVEIRRVENSD